MAVKVCTCCKIEQPFSSFAKSARESDGLQDWCKPCFSKRNAAYRAANRVKERLRHRRYQQANKDKAAAGVARYRARHPEKIKQATKRHYDRNKEKENQRSRDYYRANAAKIKAAKVAWRAKNKDRRKAYEARYVAENRHLVYAKNARRKAALLLATPSWADPNKVLAFYSLSVKLTSETGVTHHVDHIVPLRSAIVCGLHWEANLQVLTESENSSKNNRHWPDMP